MSTPRSILGRAYPRSKANKGSTDVDEPTEGLSVVQGALDRLYTLTARVKKEYFMVRQNVDLVGGKWSLPENVERVDKLWQPDGTEVARVSWEDRALHAGRKPAVYFMGRAFYPAGNVGDPVGGTLVFTYASTPPVLTIDQDLAAIWPTHHDSLLVDECAVYLALKDRRLDGEIQRLIGERNTKARTFVLHVGHVNAGEERRTGVLDAIPGAMSPDIFAVLVGNDLAAGEGG